jgi:hypothetical protein
MTEIVVIKTTQASPPVSTQEKDIIFQKLKKQINLTQTEIDFLKSEDNKPFIIPNIDELKLNKLLYYENIIVVSNPTNDKKHLILNVPKNTLYIDNKDLDQYLISDNRDYIFQLGANEQITTNTILIDCRIPIKKYQFDEIEYYKYDHFDNVVIYSMLWKSSMSLNLSVFGTNKNIFVVPITTDTLIYLNELYHYISSPKFYITKKMLYSDNIKYADLMPKCIDMTFDVPHCKEGKLCNYYNAHSHLFNFKLSDSVDGSVITNFINDDKLREYAILTYTSKDLMRNTKLCYNIAKKYNGIIKETEHRNSKNKEIVLRNIFSAFFGKLPHIPNNTSILDVIDEKQKGAINKRYDQLIKQFSNKYPWNDIIAQLRRSHNNGLVVDIGKLDVFISARSNSDWYRSQNGDPVICPHLYKLFAGEDIKNIMSVFSNIDTLTDYYFCNICSETLGRREYEPELSWSNIRENSNYDEDLYTFIMKYVIGTVKADIEFKTLIDDSKIYDFSKNITSCLVSYVKDIDHQLAKKRTLTEEQKTLQKKLFTVIFVYSILSKIILDNFENMKFLGHIITRPNKSEIVKIASNIVKTRHMSLINSIEGITQTNIEPYINNAFNEISTQVMTKKAQSSSGSYSTQGIIDKIFGKYVVSVDNKIDFGYANGKYNNIPDSEYGSNIRMLLKLLQMFAGMKVDTKQELPKLVSSDHDYLIKHKKFLKPSIRDPILKKDRSFVQDNINKRIYGLTYSILNNKLHKHSWKVDNNERICSVCNVKSHMIPIMDDIYYAKLHDLVSRRSQIDNFYNLFYNRCIRVSKDNYFHSWKNDVCEICGMTKKNIIDRDYDTFMDNYDMFHKTIEETKQSILPYKTPTKLQSIKLPVEQVDESLFNEFISKSSYYIKGSTLPDIPCYFKTINHYEIFWTNVGLFELNIFDDILNGQRPILNEQVRSRNLIYYLSLIKNTYLVFKNYINLRTISTDIKPILQKNIKIPNIDLPPIPNMLDNNKSRHLLLLLYKTLIILNDTIQDNDVMIVLINKIIETEKNITILSERDRLRIKGQYMVEIFDTEDNEPEDVDGSVYDVMDYSGENDQDD